MGLPMYKFPVYFMTLPSNGKKLRFRPFLVKDEKNLLLSQQSEEESNMLDTLKEVIRGCLLDDVNVDDMPIFDIEYIFTQLRAKSVGENVELLFTCKNKECGEQTKIEFKIDPVLVKPEGHTNKIDLFDDVGVVMKYASVPMLADMRKMDLTNPEQIVKLIAQTIDYIYDSESVYPANEQTEQELITFVEGLPKDAATKIKQFFDTTPKLQQIVEYKCPKCGTDNEYTVEGLESFF
jgi:hypothetical protein